MLDMFIIYDNNQGPPQTPNLKPPHVQPLSSRSQRRAGKLLWKELSESELM